MANPNLNAHNDLQLDPTSYITLAVQTLRCYTNGDLMKDIEVMRLLFALRSSEPDPPSAVLSAAQTLRSYYTGGNLVREAEVIHLLLTGKSRAGIPLPPVAELIATFDHDFVSAANALP